MASAVATADPFGLTEVSVQDDLDRMDVDLQGAMKAFKGSPLDDVPTGAQDSRPMQLSNGTSWSLRCALEILRSLLPPT